MAPPPAAPKPAIPGPPTVETEGEEACPLVSNMSGSLEGGFSVTKVEQLKVPKSDSWHIARRRLCLVRRCYRRFRRRENR